MYNFFKMRLQGVYVILFIGGITVLGTSIVNSCNSPSTLSGMGTIATVMQHFSGVNTFSDAHAIISSASSTKKVMQASVENKALQNFAPFCTITCESGTAQPADVLIQVSYFVINT